MRRGVFCTLGLAALLAVGVEALGAQPLPAGRLGEVEVLEVPSPDLVEVEPAVRAQLEEARRALVERRNGAAATAAASDVAAIADAYSRLGQLYLLYDLVEPAAACLENASRLDPEGFDAVYLLGTLEQHEGRLDEAAASFERCLVMRPGDLTALLRLAEVRLGQDRRDEARVLFEKALDRENGEAYAHYGLGRIAWAEGDSQAAREHFERALELQPRASALYYHLALAQRAMGDREAAQESLARRGDIEVRFPDPVALAVQRQATGAGAMLVLGRISRDEGHLEEAERRFREAVRVAPDNVAAHRALASLLEQQQRPEEALAEHLESLRLEPADPNREQRVGAILASLGRDEEAVEHFEAATRLAPDYAPAWTDLALALVRLGRDGEALEALRQIADPRPVEQRELEAILLEKLERLAEARAILEEIVTSDPEQTSALLRLALLEVRAGDEEAARRHFQHLAGRELEPGARATVEFHLGNLVSAGAPDEAIEHFQRSVELDPNEPEAHFNLATLLARAGRFDEAAAAYAAVLALQPDHPAAGLARGMALVLAGHYAEARAHLEATLEVQTSNMAAAHLLARLLATAPDENVRDGEYALALARKIFEAHPSIDHGETVAMALAELGRFEEAAEWQKKLVAELETADEPQLLASARAHLESYENGQPVRAPWR